MTSKQKPFDYFESLAIEQVKKDINSRKVLFCFNDAYKARKLASKRTETILDAIYYLKSNPLRENDYFKFVNSYIQYGVKLDEKYFKHDLDKLNEYYLKHVKDPNKINPFSIVSYENYVLFMALKLSGCYEESDNELFNVQTIGFREYNPLTKIPSVLRGSLYFEVKEYDIKRAFPSFIDIELNTDFRHDVYDKISKSKFAMYLNANNETTINIEKAKKGLEPIYGNRTDEVVTDERYKSKGLLFEQFTEQEQIYIDKFTKENGLKNYVRLHDGVFVLKDTTCENLTFDKVEFAIKECIKPKIEKKKTSFYYFDEKDKVCTSPAMYADFLKQEKFIRISNSDDKIQILKNTNNVVDFFNHRTDIVNFLESEINEPVKTEVRNKIASDNLNLIMQSYSLLNRIELEYYKDNKTSFGLPFKNGFFYFDALAKLNIEQKKYSEVKGFFTPHKSQEFEFSYTDVKGDFETFIERISTGQKEHKGTPEQIEYVDAFKSMIGYLCHNYKPIDESPCIVLTDEGANDENRNGRRGKSLIGSAIEQVTKTLIKGGSEFKSDYLHIFSDLDKSVNLYLIDDVPASFNYDALYTNISGGINVQHKGKNAQMIEREDTPKFLITSNWLLRYDDKNASTNARFIEYKVQPYYSIEHKPKHEFGKNFFQDWDCLEWNKFYSFMYRCVHSYLKDGLKRIKYDKTSDNYLAYFGSDAKESEVSRIIDVLLNVKRYDSFNVSSFLEIYNHYENPLKNEKMFNHRNTKDLIDVYLTYHKNIDYSYVQSSKHWTNNKK
jgi:hypothetical protein